MEVVGDVGARDNSFWAIKSMRERRYLYLMISGDRTFFKVGFTWNLKLRRRQLSWLAQSEMELKAYRICEDKYQANHLETKFHRSASGGKKRSEWHAYDANLIADFLKQEGVIKCS